MPKPHVTTLGAEITLGGKTPPNAFRLFKAGMNETTKGTFLFDARAAQLVMQAAAARGGVDYAIDLEHLSLDTGSPSFDPDSRGWFKLAVRNGELWAVDVRWTLDGRRRLTEGTQRYISPAFVTDADRRVVEIVNVALVAMPATQGTPALIAASRGNTMSGRVSIVALATDNAGKYAAVKDAADKLTAALEALDGAADNDVPLHVAEAEAAMQELVAALGLFKLAPEAMSFSVPSSRGPIRMRLNQVKEALRARVKLSALAESIALRGSWSPSKPRVA